MNELCISLTNLLHLENPGSSIKSVEQNFKEIQNGQRELHENKSISENKKTRDSVNIKNLRYENN